MHLLTRTITLKPQQLATHERNELAERLFTLHRRIFAGGNGELFRRQLIDNGARDSTLLLQQNRLGETIGYCALHLFEVEHQARTTGVVRIQAGLLPGYRRRNSLIPFTFGHILRHRLRHPLRPLYFLGALIHPAMPCAPNTRGSGRHLRRRWPATKPIFSIAVYGISTSTRSIRPVR